jgi:hypothetical protein
MRPLETSAASGSRLPYQLGHEQLPFLLRFAQRRQINERWPLHAGATQSDGATTSNDGNNAGGEEFDWLADD